MWQILRQITRTGIVTEAQPGPDADALAEARCIQDERLAILGRALAIREVDAGACNRCKLEIHALNNPYCNVEGLGMKFVASPCHADTLLVAGLVSRHTAEALRRTYEATPEPSLVVAVGDCGCDRDLFGESYANCEIVANVIPVDVTVPVPGCSPPPVDILQAVKKLQPGAARAFRR